MDMEQRQFRADPLKLKRLRIAAGMTVEDFCHFSELDKTTARKVLKGEPVFLKTLVIAGKTFGIESSMELLHPEEQAALGITPKVESSRQVLEWEIVDYLTAWEKAANGLQYQLVKLKHRFLEGRWARGKRYELRHLPLQERSRLEGHLHRHVDVCERIGRHENVARNITAA